jgi:hypothetical protein
MSTLSTGAVFTELVSLAVAVFPAKPCSCTTTVALLTFEAPATGA